MAETAPAQDLFLIIGLDFGTTGTGVAWIGSRNPDRRSVIRNWPHQAYDGSEKVPTKLRYIATAFEWGHTAVQNGGDDVHSLFKLALEPTKFQDAVENLGAVLNPPNLDQLIVDFLTGVFQHVVLDLGAKLGQGTVNDSRFHIVVTVPAIWSDVAKQRTLRAVQSIPEAAVPGMPRPFTASLFSEPEAAAISALHELKLMRNADAVNVGDTFVVVDAGGGTTDLITYTITSLAPRLELREATQGTGGVCGGALIDLRFQQFITERLGQEPDWDQEILSGTMDHFRTRVKPGFTMADVANNTTFHIQVPGLRMNPEVGMTRNGRFALNAADVHLCFEPDVLKIIRLVHEQIALCATPVQAILLVGGYGQSRYLRERLSLEFQQGGQNAIEVLQPPNAMTAVCDGAAMRGLVEVRPENHSIPVVKARTARKNYGFVVGEYFHVTKHAVIEDRKYWDGFDGRWRVAAMKWLTKRGQRVAEDEPILTDFFNTFPISETRVFTLELLADESPEAPVGKSDDMQTLCRLTADLSVIPTENLNQEEGADGKMWFNIKFDIEAIYRSASTQYTLIHNGVRYETVTAEYV